MSDRPVILIGAARSGTKILRDVLAASPGIAAVPYDVNYVWRFGAEDMPHDRLESATLTEKRAAFIRKTLPQQAGANAGDILLEKTVSNTLRVSFVSAVYPNASYIHLIRDGRDVVESAMRQWQVKPNWQALWTKLRGMPLSNASYALWFGGNLVKGVMSGRGGGKVWGPRFPGIVDIAAQNDLAAVCANQWVHSVRWALHDLATLDPGSVHEIRYEDMVRSPSILHDVATALSLPDPDGISAAAAARLRPQASGWNQLAKKQRDTILSIIAPTLDELGYAP